MNERQQNTNTYPCMFFMADSADHVTGKTGLTPTLTISKNGGGFGAPTAATVAELANGWYKWTGAAGDWDTVGELGIHVAAAGADACDLKYVVVPWNPFDAVRLGLTALPAVASGGKGALPVTDAATGLVLTGYGPAAIKTNADLVAFSGGDSGNADRLKDFAANGYDATGHRVLAWVKGFFGTDMGAEGAAGRVAAAVLKWFNVATPTGTVNSLPDAIPNAAGGVTIVGSQVDLVNAPNATALTAVRTEMEKSGTILAGLNAVKPDHKPSVASNGLVAADVQALGGNEEGPDALLLLLAGNAVVNANVTQIDGYTVQGNGSQLADGFISFFNVASGSRRLTLASYNQGADNNTILALLNAVKPAHTPLVDVNGYVTYANTPPSAADVKTALEAAGGVMEVLWAYATGNSTYDSGTGVRTVKGYNGTSTVGTATLAGNGVRTGSTRP